jgi:RNA polymerase sigma factor (TIGR02999 family)
MTGTSPQPADPPNTAGLRGSVDTLFPLVYGELRRIAEGQMRSASPGHTLQATALINEAYLRLANLPQTATWSRPHLLAVASLAMRQVLVNHARDRSRAKRGGGAARMTLDDSAAVGRMEDDDVLALSEALDRLLALDARKARVVEMRFFGGMSVEEIGQALEVGPATVKRDWVMARAWLVRELRAGDTDDAGPMEKA